MCSFENHSSSPQRDNKQTDTQTFQKQASQASCAMSVPQGEQQAAHSLPRWWALEDRGWLLPKPFPDCLTLAWGPGWRLLLWEMHLLFGCKTSPSDWWTSPREEEISHQHLKYSHLEKKIFHPFRKPQDTWTLIRREWQRIRFHCNSRDRGWANKSHGPRKEMNKPWPLLSLEAKCP